MKKLSNIYQELLNEDLEYAHVTDAGPESDSFEIVGEEISIPNLRLAKNNDISDEEKLQISKVSANDLQISQGDYDGKIVNMIINLPWKSEINNGGIVADIQVIDIDGVNLYQMHVELAENIRSLGLGYKVYVALIQDLGHLYSGMGRQMNGREVPKIWNKLNSENGISVYNKATSTIAILDSNPDKEELIKRLGH